jgi:hypothetical protein
MREEEFSHHPQHYSHPLNLVKKFIDTPKPQSKKRIS